MFGRQYLANITIFCLLNILKVLANEQILTYVQDSFMISMPDFRDE